MYVIVPLKCERDVIGSIDELESRIQEEQRVFPRQETTDIVCYLTFITEGTSINTFARLFC
jgi:hypothetical protein